MSEPAAMPETGFAWIVPALWLGAGELVRPILELVFASEPVGDDAPLSFTTFAAPVGTLRDADLYGCAGYVRDGVPVGQEGGVSSEYAETFTRLDALLSLAKGCATDKLKAAELSELRAVLARALNAGVYRQGDVFVCKGTERPTRGQVRAWLATLANALGRICADAELSAAAGTVAKPLDVPAAQKARVVGLSPLGWAAIAAAVGGAVLLWRAS